MTAKPTARRRVAMSPAWLKRLKPEGKPVEWRDERAAGLVLRVEASGHRSWFARYTVEGREGRFKLGTFPETSLAQARRRVRAAVADAQRGADPQGEKRKARKAGDVRSLVAAWKADTRDGPAARWRGGLTGGTGRSFLSHIGAFERAHGRKPLAAITHRVCDRFVRGANAAATRNRRLTALRMLFGWAVRRGLLDADPSRLIRKEPESERERVLSDDELRALVEGFDATRYGRVVRLLCLTGLRRDEVLGLEWSEVHGDELRLPREREKAGKARKGGVRRVALSPQAVAVLSEQREMLFEEQGSGSAFVFATTAGKRPHADALKPVLYALKGRRANGQPAERERPALLPADVTIHDLRRTVGQRLADAGVSPETISHDVLGHVRPKIRRTYMPAPPLDAAHEALTRWAHVLDGVLADERREAK